MERILDRGRLSVAIARVKLPPFLAATLDDSITGSDISLALGLAKALGVPVEWDRKAGTAEEVIGRVAAADVDIGLSRLSATLDRARRVRFSQPYLILRQALLVSRVHFVQNAGGRDPLEVAREQGAVIAVCRDSGYESYARQVLPQAHIREYASWQPDIVDAVLDGDVLAGYGDELEIGRILAQRVDSPLRLRMTVLPDARDRIAVALPWSSTQLTAWIDLYLETVAQPTADELISREAKPATPRD